jgi:peptidoglycan/LPS O-acetylase OafA/YrhL
MPSSFEKMLARLGDASYSIYLFQVFVFSAVCKLVVKLFPSFPLDALIPILTVIAILVGYFVYIFAEKPALDLCRRIGPLQRGGPTPWPLQLLNSVSYARIAGSSDHKAKRASRITSHFP